MIIINLKIIAILQDLKTQLKNLYGDGLVDLILFGSQAREEAEFGSDIDVLVVLNTPVDSGQKISRSGAIAVNLSLQYDEVISCLFMNKQQYKTRNGSLLRNIRREDIIV